MDPHRVVESLRASLVPEQQAEAEKLLVEMHKIIGFSQVLLQIVLENSLDLSVRQAGAIFLKNMIVKSWKERESLTPDEPLPFQIHENDRMSIRNVIVPAVASAPVPIQTILQVAVSRIIKCDFPTRFPTFVDQLAGYLTSANFIEFHGALLCLYSLVQAYEHKTNDKGPLPAAMGTFLPHIYQRMTVLVVDASDESLTLQKLVLKVFYRYTDFFLPTETVNEGWISEWHQLICSTLENFNGLNDDPDSIYWKRQKWSARILYCWFTNYGSPGNVQKKYATFAEWYLKSFSHQVIVTFLKICDAYRQHTFISPKVLAETLSYFAAAMSHAFSWKPLRQTFDSLLKDVIHPLLSHTTELQEMWEDDPLEFIRYKTSMYMSLHNPTDAACTFIRDACSKRKGMLDKAMQYCIQVLNSDAEPASKDGVLNMVGTVCNTLLKNKIYKKQLETFLITHVLPLFEAPEGYRRARACWLLGKLSRAEFDNTGLLFQAAEATRRLMCFDTELPVRVAAANSIFSLIKEQEETRKVMINHLPELVMQLVKLLRETEFDDLNTVLREIMIHYATEIQPCAIQMLQELSTTFVKLVGLSENGESTGEPNASGDVDYNEEKEYQSLVATGVMENIENLMQVMEEQTDLIATAEPIIVRLVQIILKNNVSDFYDEAFSLICSMTCTKISPLLWTVFDWLYIAFEQDANDFFISMMPALHNYITIDPKNFIESPTRVEMLFNMCERSLQTDEEQGVHAAKMLEVLVLNFRGQMDACVPKFVELALTRLTQTTTTVELRLMCLQVVIAAIVSSSPIVLPILYTHNWPETQTPIIENFLKIWMENMTRFTGLHDRRVCVLGLCTLLSLRAEERSPAVNKICGQYLPAILHLLTGLKQAYALKAQEEGDDDDENSDEEEEDDEDEEGEAIDSDEDIIDEEGARYLELLAAVDAENLSNDEDEEDDEDEFETDSVMEEFDTELDKEECDMDEYVSFYQLMTGMEHTDTEWYQSLVACLTDAQKSEFKEVAETALKCIEQKQSKQIEKAGGYNFQGTDVPSSFNFSGDPPPQA